MKKLWLLLATALLALSLAVSVSAAMSPAVAQQPAAATSDAVACVAIATPATTTWNFEMTATGREPCEPPVATIVEIALRGAQVARPVARTGPSTASESSRTNNYVRLARSAH